MNIYLCGEKQVRLHEEQTDAHYSYILPLTLSFSSHRRLIIVWGGNQSSDSQSGRASVYRSAGLRSRTRIPDVRFLPRAASGCHVNTHFKCIVFFCCCFYTSTIYFSAGVSSCSMGQLQVDSAELRLLQCVQHQRLSNRLRDALPGGKLQLSYGAYAWWVTAPITAALHIHSAVQH